MGFGAEFCATGVFRHTVEKNRQKNGCLQLGDSPHDLCLPSLRASPLGRASNPAVGGKSEIAVRCSPPQFPPPRKVAVANFSRHLCSMK
jgi:hypothetical protein